MNELSTEINSGYVEKEFPEKTLPFRTNPDTRKHEWDDNNLKEFLNDPENIARIIYCPKFDMDVIDSSGLLGYEELFIFITKKNYIGTESLADEAALKGLSIKIDPDKGFGIISSFDLFPRNKFDYEMIGSVDSPEAFKAMSNILMPKKV